MVSEGPANHVPYIPCFASRARARWLIWNLRFDMESVLLFLSLPFCLRGMGFKHGTFGTRSLQPHENILGTAVFAMYRFRRGSLSGPNEVHVFIGDLVADNCTMSAEKHGTYMAHFWSGNLRFQIGVLIGSLAVFQNSDFVFGH